MSSFENFKFMQPEPGTGSDLEEASLEPEKKVNNQEGNVEAEDGEENETNPDPNPDPEYSFKSSQKNEEDDKEKEIENAENEVIQKMVEKCSSGLDRKHKREIEYDSKNQEQKEEEAEKYKKEYTEALEFEENEGVNEKIKKIEEDLKKYETDEDRLKNQKKFLDLLQSKGISGIESQEDIDLVNECFKEYGEIFGLQAKRAKAEYLAIIEAIKDDEGKIAFLNEQHMPHTQAIAELERYAELMEKGIGKLSKEEMEEMEGYADVIQSAPEMGKIPEAKGKSWWYVIAIILASLSYIFDGKRWDSWAEKLTGRKVPSFAKSKDNSK